MISVLGNEWAFHVVDFISGDGHSTPESEGLIVLAGCEQSAASTSHSDA